jgi:N-acetylmuramic acid 6-phosphate etherase
LLDRAAGLIVLEIEERTFDAAVFGQNPAERGRIVDHTSEMFSDQRELEVLEEQAPVRGLALRRAGRDAPKAPRIARWRIVERKIDDIPGLEIEIVRQSNAEVGNLQPFEIVHGSRNDIFASVMSQDRLEASLDIDQRTAIEIVRIIQEEDALVAGAVAAQAERIAHAIDEIAERLRGGGRLFYAGAGTSGRIAMLDASEIPPTYGVDPSLVRVLMAGGENAYFAAVEGAEDDEENAIELVTREVTADDAVVGIAASGTTPFTVAAVKKANMIGALTVGVTAIQRSPLSRHVDLPIVVETGPEVIMGSSRMKSGTAQKLVLNQISTGVMIRLGHVYSNLMIDMPATNEKLRNRAVRMVELAAQVSRPAAVQALREAEGNLRVAAVIARRNVPADEARRILDERPLREVLGS